MILLKSSPLIILMIASLISAQCPAQDSKPEPKEKTVAQQTENVFELATDDDSPTKMGYLLFHPEKYLAQQARLDSQTDKTQTNPKKWPLLIFLHGAGERGDDLNQVRQWGPPKRVATNPDFPFVVLSPQCPKGSFWNTDHVNQLIDQIVSDNRIDTDRIYLTGLSMGGFGTWNLVAAHPTKFAAAIPICGGGDPDKAKALSNTPIWAFHGEDDNTVKVERTKKMVEAIKAIDGDKIKMTIYPGVNHNSWSKTYANPEIYEWLLSKKR